MAIPYAPSQSYIPDSSIIQLIQQAGRDAAQGQRAGGQIWANAIGNIGQIAGNTIQDIAAGKAHAAEIARKDAIEAPVRAQQLQLGQMNIEKAQREKADAEQEAMRTQKLGELFSGETAPSPNAIISVMGPQRGLAIVQGMTALMPDSEKQITRYRDQHTLFRDAIAGLAATPEPLKPQAWTMARNGLIQKGLISEDMVPAQYSPEAERIAINFGIAPEKHQGFSLNPGEVRFDANGKKIASVAPKPPAESTAKTWVMRPTSDGKLEPMFVSQSEVRPGDRPANTREQGRPITSGDSTKLSEIDNGIAQASNLKSTMNTGAASWAGAQIPDVITQATGLGAESKAQQANIQLVKQIIGKGLEGGVLRKEDEAKYERILPKLGDAPEVAQSKINDLIALLKQKKEIELNAKEDAGYDVSKFRERAGTAQDSAAPKTQTTSPGGVTVALPNGASKWFPNQAAADGFKKAAGIR